MEVPADNISDNKAHRAINPELPTKVLVHGFGSGCDNVWVYEMRSALMTVHECNIGAILPPHTTTISQVHFYEPLDNYISSLYTVM